MDRLRRLVKVVALVAPLALAAPANAADATLSGTVTDPHGAPVAAVAVMAMRVSAPYPIYGATTDASGHYTMSIPDSGYFVVRFTPPAGSNLAEITYNQHMSDIDADYLTIPFGASVTADAQLPTAGAIAGTVTDTLGSPVPGTTVIARDNPIGRVVGSTTTDVSGHYTLELGTGVYPVEFVPPPASGLGHMWFNHHAGTDTRWDNVSVTAPLVTSGIDAQLLPADQSTLVPVQPPVTPPSSPYVDPFATGSTNSDPYRDPYHDPTSTPKPAPRAHASLDSRRLHVSKVDGAIAPLVCWLRSDCRGSVVLRTSHGGRLGGTTFHVVAGRERRVRIPLSHTARRSLARHHGRLAARLTVSGSAMLARAWTVTIAQH